MLATHCRHAAVALVLLGACASHHPSPTETPAGYGAAVATNSCAPSDGPAVVLYLTRSAGTAIPPAPPYLRVALWRGVTALVGETVEWSGASALGMAELCDPTGACVAASDARVHVARRDADGSLAGDLTIHGGGTTITGTFDAAWVESMMMCG